MRRTTHWVIALAIANGLLFTGSSYLEARQQVLRTCSIETATGVCRCVHTLVAECMPGGDLTTVCQVACALYPE